ncbi:MFS transporter [Amycolatopsis dendrobii]|uniref:MFS transporter n=1 Tax=Amycolatopsis dendrobii TaxID=2760662 RepID=A0A7W3ZCB2_9PSEU|nr:MFS transporter [Amycolatopsis dendrobii]MBB1156105.1 MFS transporter [Amycolatopsis dendrobii]
MARVTTSGALRLSAPAGRWVMIATALGAGLVLLETTVVNVALPAIGEDLGASLTGLQWSVNAFTLTLSGFVLLGGALGDRFGRRRIYLVGLAWFAVASLLCGAAQNVEWLIAARALQGFGGALLVPGSLALVQEAFRPGDQARAVGAWSGLSGVAGAAGPLVGGWLVDVASWRSAFWVNVPVSLVVAVLLVRYVPESRDPGPARGFDLAGGLLAAAGLGCATYALTEASSAGWPVFASAAAGLIALAAFVQAERRRRAPMLPLELFSSREFSTANLASFCVYGALAGLFFLLPIQLQVTVGYTPLAAGLALLPATLLVLGLSARAGALTAKIGSRTLVSAGSLCCVAALLLALRIGPGAEYLADVLPTIVLIGVGIAMITPAISTAVLGAVPEQRVGIASAVNNGVARVAGLVVVAALPAVAGLPRVLAADPAALDRGFAVSMLICACLFLAGGVLTWFGMRRTASR